MPGRKNPRLKNRIDELCHQAGLTTTDLSKAINRAQSTLSMYALGQRFPCPDAIVALCDTLDCQPGDLFYVEKD